MNKIVIYPSMLPLLFSRKYEDKLRLLVAFPDLAEVFVFANMLTLPVYDKNELYYPGLTSLVEDGTIEVVDASDFDNINIKNYRTKLENAFLGDANAVTLKVAQYPSVYKEWLLRHNIDFREINNWNKSNTFNGINIPSHDAINFINNFDYQRCANTLMNSPPKNSIIPVNFDSISLSLKSGKIIIPTIYDRLYYNVFSSLFNFSIYHTINMFEDTLTKRFYNLYNLFEEIRYPHLFSYLINNLNNNMMLIDQLIELRSNFTPLRMRLLNYINNDIEKAKLINDITNAIKKVLDTKKDYSFVKKLLLGVTEGIGDGLKEGNIFKFVFKSLSPLLDPIEDYLSEKINQGNIIDIAKLISISFSINLPNNLEHLRPLLNHQILLNKKCLELYKASFNRIIIERPKGFEVLVIDSEHNKWREIDIHKSNINVFSRLVEKVNYLLYG